MKYCKDCDVHYDTPLESCLFCSSKLETIEGVESYYKYTPYQSKSKGAKLIYRLLNYLNILSILTSLYIDLTFNKQMTFSLYVISSNLYAMILLMIIYYQPKWLTKLIMFTILTIAFVIGIGIIGSDYQWSIDYVFPLSIILNELMLMVLVIFNRKRWHEYVIFLLMVSLIGIAPFILNLTGVTVVTWPGIVSGFLSLAVWIGIFFLSSRSTKEELKRRFHF